MSRSLDIAYEVEGDRVLEATLLMLGTGAVESASAKAKHPGVFMEFLRDIRRFMEVDRRSINKVYRVECRCRFVP